TIERVGAIGVWIAVVRAVVRVLTIKWADEIAEPRRSFRRKDDGARSTLFYQAREIHQTHHRSSGLVVLVVWIYRPVWAAAVWTHDVPMRVRPKIRLVVHRVVARRGEARWMRLQIVEKAHLHRQRIRGAGVRFHIRDKLARVTAETVEAIS